MSGFEFPTQKKPEAPSEENALGGLPTPAWAMTKPKVPAAAAEKEKEKVVPAEKPAQATAKPEQEKRKVRVDFSGLGSAESLLALLAVLSGGMLCTLAVWFWPELVLTLRRLV